jgi:hypothetical protein
VVIDCVRGLWNVARSPWGWLVGNRVGPLERFGRLIGAADDPTLTAITDQLVHWPDHRNQHSPTATDAPR